MRKFLYALALTTALYAPAYAVGTDAADDTEAVKTCYTESDMQAQADAKSLKLVVRLEGEKLAQFNRNYEQQFKHPAPDNDLVLFFTTSDRPDTYWLLSFMDGCLAQQPARMHIKTFNELTGGDPA